MTEPTKNSGEKLSVTSGKTLTLKRGGVEQGVVRQSFSHGRSKAVVVEKVKRRIAGPGEAKAEPAPAPDRGTAAKRSGAVRPAPGAASPPAAASGLAPKTNVTRVRTRLLMPGCENTKSASALKRKPSFAAVARRRNGPNAPRPTPASAKRKTAASTMKKPGARPTKSPRSGSAPMRWVQNPAPDRRRRLTRRKHRATGGSAQAGPRRCRKTPRPPYRRDCLFRR
jgi:translation initiation factor IF-2